MTIRVLNITPKSLGQKFGDSFDKGFSLALAQANIKSTTGLQEFLTPSEQYDYLILHWPEWIQYRLDFSTDEFVEILNRWRTLNVKTCIVIHNLAPHKKTKENLSLYAVLPGKFDLALHFESASRGICYGWATKHCLVPHPLMSLPKTPLKTNARNCLVLGEIRHKSEYSFLLKFAVIARFAFGIRMRIGRFNDFRNQKHLVNRLRHVILWRWLLGAQTNRGFVEDKDLEVWLGTSKFMLMHRTGNQLNSAIPYTALSNHLIPVGIPAINATELLQRFHVPVMKNTSAGEIFRTLRMVSKNDFSVNWTQFNKEHNLQAVSQALKRAFTSLQKEN